MKNNGSRRRPIDPINKKQWAIDRINKKQWAIDRINKKQWIAGPEAAFRALSGPHADEAAWFEARPHPSRRGLRPLLRMRRGQ
jgi:hypothetical protein